VTRFSAFGEAALLLTFQGAAGSIAGVAEAWRRARIAAIPGVTDIIPAPPALLVRFEPRLATRDAVRERLEAALRGPASAIPAPPAHHVVTVVYGGEAGPDLEALSARAGLAPEEVVRRHAAGRYTVSCTGFAPGFVYLDGLDPGLRVPRLDEPRVRVPPGSVAVAELYTGIYGAGTGGGWWLIGRTDMPTFDPGAEPPSPFALGDTASFAPLP